MVFNEVLKVVWVVVVFLCMSWMCLCSVLGIGLFFILGVSLFRVVSVLGRFWWCISVLISIRL